MVVGDNDHLVHSYCEKRFIQKGNSAYAGQLTTRMQESAEEGTSDKVVKWQNTEITGS